MIPAVPSVFCHLLIMSTAVWMLAYLLLARVKLAFSLARMRQRPRLVHALFLNAKSQHLDLRRISVEACCIFEAVALGSLP